MNISYRLPLFQLSFISAFTLIKQTVSLFKCFIWFDQTLNIEHQAESKTIIHCFMSKKASLVAESAKERTKCGNRWEGLHKHHEMCRLVDKKKYDMKKWRIKRKHRKNCECCPGHYLIVNHYSLMSWFEFRNLSVIISCVTKHSKIYFFRSISQTSGPPPLGTFWNNNMNFVNFMAKNNDHPNFT